MSEENKIIENKAKRFLPLKVIIAVIFAVVTIFLIWTFLDVFDDSNVNLSFGVWLAIIHIIIGGIAYGVNVILSLIGLILTLVKVKPIRKGQVVYFVVFIALPVIIWLIGLFVLPTLFV